MTPKSGQTYQDPVNVVKFAASIFICWLAVAAGAPAALAANPQVSLTATGGPPGTNVAMSGRGFPPGEIVAIYIDSPDPYLGQPGTVVKADGTFQFTFQWPGAGYDKSHRVNPAAPGQHQVCADTSWPGSTQTSQAKSCAIFIAQLGPSPTLSSSPTPAPVAQGPSLSPTSVLIVLAVMAVVATGLYFIQRRIGG